MKKSEKTMLDNQSSRELVNELNAIKRLLALALLRDGASQQQVARAAGVAKRTINQLANGGGGTRHAM